MHLGGQQANKLKGHLRDISHGSLMYNLLPVKLKSVSLGRFEASDPKGTYHGAEISDSKAYSGESANAAPPRS